MTMNKTQLSLLSLLLAINSCYAFDNFIKTSFETDYEADNLERLQGTCINFLSNGFILAPSKNSDKLQMNVISTNPFSFEYFEQSPPSEDFAHFTNLGNDRFIEYSYNQDSDDHGLVAYFKKYDSGIIVNDSIYSGEFAVDISTVYTGSSSSHISMGLNSVFICKNSKVAIISLATISE